MSNATPEELLNEAKKPGVFSILNVLKERAYPRDVVEIVLDEELSFKAAIISEKIEDIDSKFDGSLSEERHEELVSEKEQLVSEREELLEKIKASRFSFNIVGISEGKRDEIYSLALEKFPMEYVESGNAFLGDKKREEVENPERDRYFTNLVWSEHIESVVDPDGNIQPKMNVDEIIELRNNLPISATTKINEAIEKLRVATAMFMIGVDEDFLAKS